MKKIIYEIRKPVEINIITSLSELKEGSHVKFFDRFNNNLYSNDHSFGTVVFKDDNIALIKWANTTKYFILNDNMIKEERNHIQIIEPQEFTAQVI